MPLVWSVSEPERRVLAEVEMGLIVDTRKRKECFFELAGVEGHVTSLSKLINSHIGREGSGVF